jgi:hypothetical protein
MLALTAGCGWPAPSRDLSRQAPQSLRKSSDAAIVTRRLHHSFHESRRRRTYSQRTAQSHLSCGCAEPSSVVKFLYLGSFPVALMWEDDKMSPALYETAREPRPRTRRHVGTSRETIAESLQRPDARRHQAFIYAVTPEQREDRQIIDKLKRLVPIFLWLCPTNATARWIALSNSSPVVCCLTKQTHAPFSLANSHQS